MKQKVIAPHKVRLTVHSRFSEQLCFEWGSKFGYVEENDLRKIRRYPGLAFRGKIKLTDNYVLVYQNPSGKMITPQEVRIGRRKGEMTFRARAFHIDEIELVRK